MHPIISLPLNDPTGLSPPLTPEWHPQIQLQEPPRSSAADFLASSSKLDTSASNDNPLLQAVKGALRGRDTDSPSSIQTSWFHDADNPDGREISWNGKQVTLSSGGAMIKRWSFFSYKEDVQYACLGVLEQNALEAQKYFTPAPTTASVSKDDSPQTVDDDGRPTFGPFTHSQRTSKRRKFADQKQTISAVFVFLRSIGKIYLQNGIDYTVNIPFVVRRAWPLSPHGVLVQRVLEASELEEASMTGEPVLPTIFSITSPFQEPAAVGLAARIEGGPGSDGTPLVIHTEDEKSSFKSISPTEMVLWASHGPASKHIHPDREGNKALVVTVDPRRGKVSIWAYAYSPDSLPPQQPAPSAPDPATAAVLNQVKSRPSGIISHGRRTSSVFEGDRLDSKHSTQTLPIAQEGMGGLNVDGFPIATGVPSSLSAVTAFPSMTSVPGTTKLKTEKLPEPPDERMRANYWMECIMEVDILQSSTEWWRIMKAVAFDERFDGKIYRSRLAICFRDLVVVHIFNIAYDSEAKRFRAIYSTQYPGMAIASVIATRPGIADLIIVTAEGRVYLVSDRGIYSINLVDVSCPPSIPYAGYHISRQGLILDLDDIRGSYISVVYQNGWVARANVNMIPPDELTLDGLRVLSRALPSPLFVALHSRYLSKWSSLGRTTNAEIQFDCLRDAVVNLLNLPSVPKPVPDMTPWGRLGTSGPHARYREDIALKGLKIPPTMDRRTVVSLGEEGPSPWHGPALYALHSLGEALRLQQQRHPSLLRLASLICSLALPVRPEWADYWKRLVPDVLELWPDPSQFNIRKVEDRLPTWPQDACAYIHATLLQSAKQPRTAWNDISYITKLYEIDPPYTFGSQDPLKIIADTSYIYALLSGPETASLQKRAENAIQWLLESGPGLDIIDMLPLGVASPIREAVRTCQLTPPSDWPVHMYTRIGRNDLAASASENPDRMMTEGYRPAKDFMASSFIHGPGKNPTKAKTSIGKIISDAKAAAAGEVDATSGVEMEDNQVGRVRFKDDKRLDEIARMLNSSIIATIKAPDKPEQSEHDQTKEHQNHILRVAERTLSLPYGRAMYTFGSVTNVTRESHAVPKIEYSIKIVPLNITVTPEAGKLSPEAMHWGEFHNGVAAGLRIAPTAKGVESSWIAFNRPSELTPEHAGFLFALGLTGHLKELMTWHTFQYLTPKHDLTSIAVLLGLAASHIGKGTQKVVKLIAVHTPALLPVANVDLNVSLLTQTAGLSALGLLYMGTKNRRMAEVCLGEISRKDLVQQDLSNEHREAYTFSAAIAFGMIMLGKGSLIPADLDLVHRLSILLHGDVTRRARDKPINPFDINLTSPAAAIALGLMYLKTNRQDIADTLTIPDTAVLLNRIPPHFLLIRMIAKGMIMWDSVQPTKEWVTAQIPQSLAARLAPLQSGQARVHDDAYELAYYHLVAGCCFVLGLKYAGTASHDAYSVISDYYEVVAKLVSPTGGMIYDEKIKRAALREGLNQISLALCMVMAGTADITVLRRIRFAYGIFQNNMYHVNFRYGVHVATMQSLGLLGLGGGRLTLGTSDAAIACMVAAFFPRQHVNPFDNKCYLQALRHLWVLAVEPRCLVARDVDTGEVVYLPVKVTIRDGERIGTSQLLSPTLIPSIEKVVSIRVDTPRYWPFYLDTAQERNREALIRNQTLYVKRRTAFLSYVEDPRGSRSLFVRSGAGSGDGQILDFPKAMAMPVKNRGRDLSQFITSFSNNVIFLAFADALCRSEDEDATSEEKAFHSYTHAALLDCIMQDKPRTLQSHLSLYYTRYRSPKASNFNLIYQDLKFATAFYKKVYGKYSNEVAQVLGQPQQHFRPGLMRETQLFGAVLAMETQLDEVRTSDKFMKMLGRYVRDEAVRLVDGDNSREEGLMLERMLAWYLLKNCVPNPEVMTLLRQSMMVWRENCLQMIGGDGDAQKVRLLDVGLKEGAHITGSKLMNSYFSSANWSARSLDEIFRAWEMQ